MLLVINGAPAAGKSTLAQRYADDHALALVIDVDRLRRALGQWEVREESRVVARDLAVALAHAHLIAGHDVIVPQYVGRPEFLERLRALAVDVGTFFAEVVLVDDPVRIIERFRLRRAEFARAGVRHPESDLADDAIADEIGGANDRLLRAARARGAAIVSAADGLDAAFDGLLAALATIAG